MGIDKKMSDLEKRIKEILKKLFRKKRRKERGRKGWRM